MDARLDAEQIACVRRIAALYELGQTENGAPWQDDPKYNLGISSDRWKPLLEMMEQIGVIDAATHDPEPFFSFRITPHAVRVADDIRRQDTAKPAPRNIVAEIQEKAKGNPVIAWGIIALIVLTTLAALAASILTIIDKWIDLQKKLGP